VLSVADPITYEGKNNDGSAYRTTRRRIEVFCGASGSVICSDAVKEISELQPVKVGSVCNWPIIGAKQDGKQMVFRVRISG